jgi:hypothetical protein
MAEREGISLNHFISLAITEKVTRMEIFPPAASYDHQRHSEPERPVRRLEDIRAQKY